MPKKESLSQVINAASLNDAALYDHYMRFQNLVCSMFEWSNLPLGCNERFIERVLYEQGQVAFHFDSDLGVMVSMVAGMGKKNHLAEYTRYRVYNTGEYSEHKDADEIVLCRNNRFSVPTQPMVFLYARRLADIDRTVDVNLHLQKHPLLILCNETERLSLQQLWMKAENNEGVIFGTKDLDMFEKIKVFNTDAPYLADKLLSTKETILNEFYTRLGINNANTTKRERLIVDEVNANNETLELNIQTLYLTRKAAVEELNEKFKEHLKEPVSVKLRFAQPESEDPSNGEVHDDDQDAAGA
jgi:hypothetical protein